MTLERESSWRSAISGSCNEPVYERRMCSVAWRGAPAQRVGERVEEADADDLVADEPVELVELGVLAEPLAEHQTAHHVGHRAEHRQPRVQRPMWIRIRVAALRTRLDSHICLTIEKLVVDASGRVDACEQVLEFRAQDAFGVASGERSQSLHREASLFLPKCALRCHQSCVQVAKSVLTLFPSQIWSGFSYWMKLHCWSKF